MTTCPNKLETRGITLYYEGMLVLSEISIFLQRGEIVSLVGPSGCGKSSLFNIISGILAPDGGSVWIDGKDDTCKTGRVSYMQQKDLLLPWLSIEENVAMPLLLKGIKKKEAVKEAFPLLAMFGLSGFEKKYPHQLSGGMRSRAALLRTYLFSRDIMLLDEPFTGLDAITRNEMQQWLLGILKEIETSVLFITHDIEEAIFLSDRIYLLGERPATVRKVFEVPFVRPRSKDLIATVSFNQMKRDILGEFTNANF